VPRARATTQQYRGVSSPLCRDGESAISGGVRAPLGTEIHGLLPEPRETKDRPHRTVYPRWRAAQATLLFEPVVPLTVLSYCG
jgi:hypothetical protein